MTSEFDFESIRRILTYREPNDPDISLATRINIISKPLRSVHGGSRRVYLNSFRQSERADYEFQLAAVRAHGDNIRFCKATKAVDAKLRMLAVQSNGTNIQYLRKRERACLQLRLTAIKQNPYAFCYLTRRERRDEILKRAAFEGFGHIPHDLHSTEERDPVWIELMQVEKERYGHIVIDKPLYIDKKYDLATRMKMLSEKPHLIYHFDADALKEEEIQLLAIDVCCDDLLNRTRLETLMQYHKWSKAVVIAMLQKKVIDPLMLWDENTIAQHYKPDWHNVDLCAAVVKRNGSLITRIPKPTRHAFAVRLACVQENGTNIRLLKKKWRQEFEIRMAAVTTHGTAIAHLDPDERQELDIRLKAVARDGRAIQFLSVDERADPLIKSTALASNIEAILHLTPDERKDIAVLKAAVYACNGYAHNFDRLRSENGTGLLSTLIRENLTEQEQQRDIAFMTKLLEVWPMFYFNHLSPAMQSKIELKRAIVIAYPGYATAMECEDEQEQEALLLRAIQGDPWIFSTFDVRSRSNLTLCSAAVERRSELILFCLKESRQRLLPMAIARKPWVILSLMKHEVTEEIKQLAVKHNPSLYLNLARHEYHLSYRVKLMTPYVYFYQNSEREECMFNTAFLVDRVLPTLFSYDEVYSFMQSV